MSARHYLPVFCPLLSAFCLVLSAFCFLLLAFRLLFFNEARAVAFDPAFEIVRRLLQFVGVDETAPQGLKEGAGANVVGEFVVSLVRRAFGRGRTVFRKASPAGSRRRAS